MSHFSMYFSTSSSLPLSLKLGPILNGQHHVLLVSGHHHVLKDGHPTLQSDDTITSIIEMTSLIVSHFSMYFSTSSSLPTWPQAQPHAQWSKLALSWRKPVLFSAWLSERSVESLAWFGNRTGLAQSARLQLSPAIAVAETLGGTRAGTGSSSFLAQPAEYQKSIPAHHEPGLTCLIWSWPNRALAEQLSPAFQGTPPQGGARGSAFTVQGTLPQGGARGSGKTDQQCQRVYVLARLLAYKFHRTVHSSDQIRNVRLSLMAQTPSHNKSCTSGMEANGQGLGRERNQRAKRADERKRKGTFQEEFETNRAGSAKRDLGGTTAGVNGKEGETTLRPRRGRLHSWRAIHNQPHKAIDRGSGFTPTVGAEESWTGVKHETG
ncbi:hypothetical protein EDB83DRAFT_2326131 [Lactarius deliciosus]|nr:hypothetical protein EDB83DRAFT_2326131 [Lactarius deliciosus]